MSDIEWINNFIIQAIDNEDWSMLRYFTDLLDEML